MLLPAPGRHWLSSRLDDVKAERKSAAGIIVVIHHLIDRHESAVRALQLSQYLVGIVPSPALESGTLGGRKSPFCLWRWRGYWLRGLAATHHDHQDQKQKRCSHRTILSTGHLTRPASSTPTSRPASIPHALILRLCVAVRSSSLLAPLPPVHKSEFEPVCNS